MQQLKLDLERVFNIKYIGTISPFLGVEFNSLNHGIHWSAEKYDYHVSQKKSVKDV